MYTVLKHTGLTYLVRHFRTSLSQSLKYIIYRERHSLFSTFSQHNAELLVKSMQDNITSLAIKSVQDISLVYQFVARQHHSTCSKVRARHPHRICSTFVSPMEYQPGKNSNIYAAAIQQFSHNHTHTHTHYEQSLASSIMHALGRITIAAPGAINPLI